MRSFQDINLKALARKAMQQYGFEASFPDTVLRELDSVNAGSLVGAETNKVKDLRHLLWSSIDNSDSLDLDQIEYCERGQNGEIHVKVGVADVDLFAPKGSVADGHAHQNTTSVYTGIEVFPMFPNRMSTDLSSLKAGEDRIAVVIEFSVLINGEILPADIYRALVKNKAKLVYEPVGAWLEGSGPIPSSVSDVPGLDEQIMLQDDASRRLGDFRTEQGSLELGTIEARAVVREENVADLVVVEHNRAHELIENFMVGANRVMSGFLEAADIPIIQRVVRTPRDWKGIVDVAKAHGKTLPPEPDAIALSKFLTTQKKADTERFPDLSLAVVKLLGAGEYVMLTPNAPHIGHFCLAVTDYTHATAPNRRYVDVVIQRLLKAALSKAPCPYTKEELTALATWCTNKEKESKKVERFMRKAEAATLLAGKIGHSFEAFVTGSSEKGMYVRLIKPPAEGRVMRGGKGFKVGQKVLVKLVNLDPTRGFIDFEQTR